MSNRMEVLAYLVSNFRVYPIENTENGTTTDFLDRGVLLNFKVSGNTTSMSELKSLFSGDHNPFKSLDYKTIMTRSEGEDPYTPEILARQVLEYFESYVLGVEGFFNLNLPTGQIHKIALVNAISYSNLGDLIRKRVYTNAPIKDVNILLDVIRTFNIDLDINMVANNEVRVALFNKDHDVLKSGDDVVRWIVYYLTDSTLLIKSRPVIQQVGQNILGRDDRVEAVKNVLYRHIGPLSQVFHRHKNLLLALKKNRILASVINEISRKAKKNHVPVKPSLANEFVTRYLNGAICPSSMYSVTNRQLFKILNVLEYRLANLGVEGYIIRNGKSWTKKVQRTNIQAMKNARTRILEEIKSRLRAKLNGKTILLPENVDYGLPISEKQTIGRLPFGTRIYSGDEKISCGIFWKNDWGAMDLDLSTVDQQGNRTGWGYYGYNTDAATKFSGDVTSANKGAMEFIVTSDKDRGLFVNIFSGDEGSGYELIVGKDGDLENQWIDEPIMREKASLASRGNVIGFTGKDEKGMYFLVYQTALNSNRANFGEVNPFIKKALVRNWTVKEILRYSDIHVSTTKEKVDYDLSYDSFSFSKLAEMLDC